MAKKETKTLSTTKSASRGTVPKKEVELRTSPRDVFLHLLMLVMLYLGVIGLITLVFAYIDYSFPDPLSYYYSSGLLNDIRWQSSMLIVSFPLLLLLSHFVQSDFRKHPKKHDLKFNKWLTYLTLFVTAITIVIDLIMLVNRFYGGELTTTFVLRVLWVLIVAGAVFGYYLWDVQSESYKSKIPSVVAWISSVVVVGMLALGFILAGSPSHQREIRMDEQRANDLSNIQNQIINYWQTKRSLPSSVEAMKNDLNYFSIPKDPQTGADYEYAIKGEMSFELCATFVLDSKAATGKSYNSMPYDYDSELWQHSAGRTCFDRTIDPDLYPKP